MIGSVDSTSFVRSFPNLRIEDLANLGLAKKRDKFGGWRWIDNGARELHEPQLTFYQTYGGIFRLRADVNFAKLFHGSNIELPRVDEIQDGLEFLENNIANRTGLSYDAFTAEVCRVHYALNENYEDIGVKPVIEHFSRYRVPRMTRTVIDDETVYYQNGSRGIRIYDKNAEIVKHNPIPELISRSANIVRYELFLDGLTPVKRFAKRMGFCGTSAGEMLSESNINAAITEMQTLLALSNLNLTSQSGLKAIFDKTNNINQAMARYGFLQALKILGEDFWRNPDYGMSRSTFYDKLRECQKLGLCA